MLEKTSPEDDLFEEALLKTSGPERAAFLEGACRNHQELRARLEMMIEGHFNANGFLETLPGRLSHQETKDSAESTGFEQVGSSIGPYKLLQKIGEGGCGVVYMAEQEHPVRRRVARGRADRSERGQRICQRRRQSRRGSNPLKKLLDHIRLSEAPKKC